MKKKISALYYSQLLVIASLPYHFLLSSYLIGVLLLLFIYIFLMERSFRKEIQDSIRSNIIAQLLIVYFLTNIVFIGIHIFDYSSQHIYFSEIEKNVSFVIFPIIFANIPTYTKRQIRLFFKLYMINVFLSSIIALLSGFYEVVQSTWIYQVVEFSWSTLELISYHKLGSYIGIHGVYFAEYVLMAFIILVHIFYSRFSILNYKEKIGYAFIGLYFIGIIFLLKSASVIISLIVIMLLLTVFIMHKHKYNFNIKTKLFIVLSLIFLVLILGSRIHSKFGEDTEYFTYAFSQNEGWNTINLRLAKFEIAQKAIADNWLFGVGPGNAPQILDSYYKKFNFYIGLKNHFNTHNQFLQTFLVLGITGFVVLLAIMWTSIYTSYNKRDSIMFLFIISFAFFSMSESTLVVNKGIVYFTILLSLFSFIPKKAVYYM